MGLLSIFIANAILIMMFLGACFLTVGIILSTICRRKKKNGQKVGFGLKFFVVLSDLLGLVMCILPLVVVCGINIFQRIEFARKVNSYPVQIKVDSNYQLSDGFVVDDVKYVVVDELNPNFSEAKEPYAAIYWGVGHLIPVYSMPNDAGVEMFVSNGMIFVAENETDEVAAFYESSATYDYELSHGNGGHDWEYHDLEITDEFFYSLSHVADTEDMVEFESSDVTDEFYITATSSDGVNYMRIVVYVTALTESETCFVIRNDGDAYIVPEDLSEQLQLILQ